jgi:hypothetical protein
LAAKISKASRGRLNSYDYKTRKGYLLIRHKDALDSLPRNLYDNDAYADAKAGKCVC